MLERGEGTGIFFFSREKASQEEISASTKVLATDEQCSSRVQKHSFSYSCTFATFIFMTFVLLLNQLAQAKETMSPSACRNAGECLQNKGILKSCKILSFASQVVPWYRGRAGGPILILLENSFDVTKNENSLKFLPNVGL